MRCRMSGPALSGEWRFTDHFVKSAFVAAACAGQGRAENKHVYHNTSQES